MLANRGRVRAKFDEDCPALDFYGGFYLQDRGRADLRAARRDPFADGRKLRESSASASLVPEVQATELSLTI